MINQILAKWHQRKELAVSDKTTFIYTDEQLMARLKFFIGICLALTLTGIVFVVLYSLIFVTQPLNAISPIDQKFFELIVPIATFLTGTLSGIMLAGNSKEDKEAMMQMQKQAQETFKSYDKPIQQSSPNTGGMKYTPSRAEPYFQQSPQVVTGYGGKPAPAELPQPEL